MTHKFFEWMEKNGLKPADVAHLLKIDNKTLSAYKSRGLPQKLIGLADKIIETWDQPDTDPDSTQRVAIEFTDEEYDLITDAATIVEENARKFMHRAILIRARQALKEKTKTNLPRVAENPKKYTTD